MKMSDCFNSAHSLSPFHSKTINPKLICVTFWVSANFYPNMPFQGLQSLFVNIRIISNIIYVSKTLQKTIILSDAQLYRTSVLPQVLWFRNHHHFLCPGIFISKQSWSELFIKQRNGCGGGTRNSLKIFETLPKNAEQ